MATAGEGTSLPRPAVAIPLPRLWLSDATGKRREVSETGGDVPQGTTAAFAEVIRAPHATATCGSRDRCARH
jgi:hypothetical protein